jgi:hypothetical protein
MNSSRRHLPDEFVHSAALNAGRSLVHRWLAQAERPAMGESPPKIFVPDAGAVAPPGDFGAEYTASHQAGDALTLEFALASGVLVAVHRAGSNGGRLASATFTPNGNVAVPSRDTWHRNRVLAFAHRFLWAWENVRDGEAFADLLDPRSLDAHVGDGLQARSGEEFLTLARALDASAAATHHALRLFSFEVNDDHYDVSAEFDWRAMSAQGTPLRARTRHTWRLRETGDRYPLLGHLIVDVVHPVEPDIYLPGERPELASAPSDDAESGGP